MQLAKIARRHGRSNCLQRWSYQNGYYADKLRYFLVPEPEYDKRPEFGFVIEDEKKYEEAKVTLQGLQPPSSKQVDGWITIYRRLDRPDNCLSFALDGRYPGEYKETDSARASYHEREVLP